VLAAAAAAAGCGAGGGEGRKIVQGTGYTFSTPSSWEVVRTARQIQAVEGKHSLALVAVSHAVQYALVTGLGLIFFAREQLSPRDLRPALAERAA